ncbi:MULTISPECIES: DUF6296 family protein [Kitasatospora]|uniref:Uncharacterized protein n=1 Tax=Kitasatospora setae (strain ATCC 33774 / DSM 43861 / JCM 3304 / KCC A-0304 / NBRC 14216 / KM-6054) TaxID=452652 RepID=E4N5V5_KITSK|nr:MULTISPECIES: DUF6296 family protein [Kitasatospora]BAJ26586.1 hypothetical protein KSE_07460 [Kitasatospora setae KM-6054]
MDGSHGYRIAVPGQPGAHAPQVMVVVYRSGETTPDGLTVYLGAGGLRVTVHGSVACFLEPYPPGLAHPYGYAYPLAEA